MMGLSLAKTILFGVAPFWEAPGCKVLDILTATSGWSEVAAQLEAGYPHDLHGLIWKSPYGNAMFKRLKGVTGYPKP